jgi:DNA polymerase III alpha subunit
MMIDQLKKHVTHFSEELSLKAKAKDDVIVGGRIISVEKISEQFFDETYYKVTLDDYVGTTKVIISSEMYQHYFEDIAFVDTTFLIKGIVNVVSRKVATGIESQFSVVGYEIIPLPLEVTAHA